MTKSITSFFSKKTKKNDEPAPNKKQKLSSDDVKGIEIKNIVDQNTLCKEVQDLLKHLKSDSAETKLTWSCTLQKYSKSSGFASLARFVAKERLSNPNRIYPPAEETFASLNMTPLRSVKVVIIGQDPYHGPGQGHGLCFSVRRGVAIPPSLRNIYKEIYGANKVTPKHGNLESWANQGVLLLNTVLTVRSGQANSHKNRGWESFTDEVVRILNREMNGLVFLLWGKPSQEKGKCINRSKHVVITSSHPSPLGASKTNEPFLGSNCFERANEALKEQGKDPINWHLPP